MTKSKKLKPTKAKKKTQAQALQSQPLNPQQIPSSSKRRVLDRIYRLLRAVPHYIRAIMGPLTLPAIFGIGLSVYGAFRGPEILPPSAQVDDPFLVRFSLHNPSYIFSMDNVHVECGLVDVKTTSYRFQFIRVATTEADTSIPHRETRQYQCPLRKVFAGPGVLEVTNATVVIIVKFKTLILNRETNSQPQNWDNKVRQWTEGDIIN